MKPTTIALLQKCKQEKRRFATITAYDYSFAKLFAEEGINVMLVGDSLGMTVQGHYSAGNGRGYCLPHARRTPRSAGLPAPRRSAVHGVRHAGAGV